MIRKITDKKLRQLFWDAIELPFENKARYLLGDLSKYGVSRCKKIFSGKNKWVWYEFDIYRNGKHKITMSIELPLDFKSKDIEKAITLIQDKGGIIASDDIPTFKGWDKKIRPEYNYDHARSSGLKFLEDLKLRLFNNKFNENRNEK